MSTAKTIFAVYRCQMLMHEYDECYTEESTSTESEDLGTFATEAEALALLESIRHELSYEITKTMRGLDSITYDEVIVDKETVEVDDDGHEDLLESETLHVASGLPDEVREAVYRSQSSYHKYLDHQASGYRGIHDFM